MDKIKNMTWAQLKRIVNKIPISLLKEEVTIWTDYEQRYKIDNVQVLKEDYIFDGDENSIPRSIFKKADPEFYKESKNDVTYPKGTRIINAAK